MRHKVGPKGQVVISKEIRDCLGVEPGWVAIQRLVDDHVVLYLLPPEHNRSLKGSLSAYAKAQIPSEELEKAEENAWMQAAANEFLRNG